MDGVDCWKGSEATDLRGTEDSATCAAVDECLTSSARDGPATTSRRSITSLYVVVSNVRLFSTPR